MVVSTKCRRRRRKSLADVDDDIYERSLGAPCRLSFDTPHRRRADAFHEHFTIITGSFLALLILMPRDFILDTRRYRLISPMTSGACLTMMPRAVI